MAGNEKFDALIVGAGPAGATAALVLARGGMSVGLLEQAETPGANTPFGQVLCPATLFDLLPGFADSAPLERRLTRRRLALLGPDGQVAIDSVRDRAGRTAGALFHTVSRPRFDAYLAGQAQAAGARLLVATGAESLLVDNGVVVGAIAGRDHRELRAQVVVVADGCNSFLARKAHLRTDFRPDRMWLASRELLRLDPEIIDQRFNLHGRQGAMFEFFGPEVCGELFGGGFLHTGADWLTIGVSYLPGASPGEHASAASVLERFRNHPAVAPLLAGAQTVEHDSQVIPLFSRETLARVFAAGVVFVGDAAGLVEAGPIRREGMNLAMASARAAAETVLALRAEGQPFTAANLARYPRLAEQLAAHAHARELAKLSAWAQNHPRMFRLYPGLLAGLAGELFFQPGGASRQRAWRAFRKRAGLMRTVRDTWQFFRLLD